MITKRSLHRRRNNTQPIFDQIQNKRCLKKTKFERIRLALSLWLHGHPIKERDNLSEIFPIRKSQHDSLLTNTDTIKVRNNSSEDALRNKDGECKNLCGLRLKKISKYKRLKNDSGTDEPIRIIHLPPNPCTSIPLSSGRRMNKKDDLRSADIPNRIRTAKYSLITFLPKNLFEQFRRVANFYFLVIVILQAIPALSNYNVFLAALPMLVIIIVTALKDGIEDWKRYRQDKTVNNNFAKTLQRSIFSTDTYYLKRMRRFEWFYRGLEMIRHFWTMREIECEAQLAFDGSKARSPFVSPNPHIGWRDAYWKDIRVGDIVYLSNNEMIPADILIISTSEFDSQCYVETKNLDGETNLKIRKGPKITQWIQTADDAANLRATIEVELPNSSLYSFSGKIIMQKIWIDEKMTDKLNIEQESNDYEADWSFDDLTNMTEISAIDSTGILLRGCVLRNTAFAIGVVIYTGAHTKLMLNSGGTPSKRSRIERQMNPQVMQYFFKRFNEVFLLDCLKFCAPPHNMLSLSNSARRNGFWSHGKGSILGCSIWY